MEKIKDFLKGAGPDEWICRQCKTGNVAASYFCRSCSSKRYPKMSRAEAEWRQQEEKAGRRKRKRGGKKHHKAQWGDEAQASTPAEEPQQDQRSNSAPGGWGSWWSEGYGKGAQWWEAGRRPSTGELINWSWKYFRGENTR